jgi:hypothetical protein
LIKGGKYLGGGNIYLVLCARDCDYKIYGKAENPKKYYMLTGDRVSLKQLKTEYFRSYLV